MVSAQVLWGEAAHVWLGLQGQARGPWQLVSEGLLWYLDGNLRRKEVIDKGPWMATLPYISRS